MSRKAKDEVIEGREIIVWNGMITVRERTLPGRKKIPRERLRPATAEEAEMYRQGKRWL